MDEAHVLLRVGRGKWLGKPFSSDTLILKDGAILGRGDEPGAVQAPWSSSTGGKLSVAWRCAPTAAAA
jgi:hypothetical protein